MKPSSTQSVAVWPSKAAILKLAKAMSMLSNDYNRSIGKEPALWKELWIESRKRLLYVARRMIEEGMVK